MTIATEVIVVSSTYFCTLSLDSSRNGWDWGHRSSIGDHGERGVFVSRGPLLAQACTALDENAASLFPSRLRGAVAFVVGVGLSVLVFDERRAGLALSEGVGGRG